MKQQLNMCRYLFIACLFPLITACIIPIPLGSEITMDDVQSIRPGVTTKGEIVAMLGEPNVLDTPSFSVYRLGEGKSMMIVFLKEMPTAADEIYDLTFSFDSDGIVKEFNYETVVRGGNYRYKSLDDEFPDQSTEISEDIGSSVDISRDGRWVSAILLKGGFSGPSYDKLVFHEIGGKSTAIDIKGLLPVLDLSRDTCKRKLQATQDKSSRERIEWLFANADLTTFYEVCRKTSSVDIFLNQLDMSNDGSLLAVGDKKDLTLWSDDQGALLSVRTTGLPITNVNFSPDNKFLVSVGTTGYVVGSLFAGERNIHHYISEINMWTVPSLDNILKIERKVPPYATAFSEDGKFFSLASATHIEIWERLDSSSATYGEAWPYKLENLIPQPVIGNYRSLQREGRSSGSLSFSSDGKLLMSVKRFDGGVLQIWDTRSGKLLAQLGAKFGLFKAEFNKDSDIVIAGGAYKHWYGPAGARVWKIPLSAVVTRSDDSPGPGSEPPSKPDLLIPSENSPEIASITAQSKPKKTLKIEDDSRISATKMRTLISGNSSNGQSENGNDFHVYNDSDGTMKGESQGSIDSGTWEINDAGQYCRKWKKWRNGSVDCYLMYSLGNNKYRMKAIGKSYESTFMIFQGKDTKLPVNISDVQQDGAFTTTQNQPPAATNFSGTYISSITGNWHFAFTLDGPTPEVNLEQNGSEIKGSFGSHGGKIWGVIEGDAVSFNWLGLGTRGGTGKWIFKRGSDDIEGNWSTSYGIDATGTWNLKKIE